MTDIATDLKERFDWAVYLSLEAYEVLPMEDPLYDQMKMNARLACSRICATPLTQSRRH
jgi:hypothetical protein